MAGPGTSTTSHGWTAERKTRGRMSTPSGQAAAPADARNKKLVGQLKEAQARERDRDREEVR